MKKKWIIVAVVLILVAGGLGGYLIGQHGIRGDEYSTPPNYPGVKGYPVNMPPEVSRGEITIEVDIDEEVFKADVFQFTAMVRNNSNRILSGQFLYVIYSGKEIIKEEVRDFYNLGPGQTQKIAGGAGWGKQVNKFTYTLQNLEWEGGQTELTPPKEPESPAKPTAENVYYSAPENPTIPAEVVAAFYFLADDGKNWETAKLCVGVEEFINAGKIIESDAELLVSDVIDSSLRAAGQQLEKITITSVSVEAHTLASQDYNNDPLVKEIAAAVSQKAEVSLILYFKDGTRRDGTRSLLRYFGKWRVVPDLEDWGATK